MTKLYLGTFCDVILKAKFLGSLKVSLSSQRKKTESFQKKLTGCEASVMQACPSGIIKDIISKRPWPTLLKPNKTVKKGHWK